MSIPVDPPSNAGPADFGPRANDNGADGDATDATSGTFDAADAVDVQSNAFNFLSCVQTGVDPRTGLYTVGLQLPEIQGNGLMGPSLPLTLNFNPMQTSDTGFGIGWSLSTSLYDRKTKQLQLATGERYHAVDTGAAFVIRDRKLRNVCIEKAQDGSGDLLLYFLSGLVERLSNASGRDDRYLPITRCQADGRALHFSYTPFRGQRLLSGIADDERPLVALSRSDTEIRITLCPDTSHSASFSLALINGRVSRLRLAADAGDWQFTYRSFPNASGLAFIESMSSPSGLRETLRYEARGHALPPRAPFTHLPVVIEQIQYPGAGQVAQRRLFTYSNNNFLGINAPGIRWEDGQDNLFSVLADYRYSSVERWMQGEGDQADVLKSISRVYNRYHLQCEETVSQGDAVQRQLTRYHEQPGRPFSEQVAYYALPAEVLTEQYRSSAPDRVSRTRTQTVFDDFGNLLEQIDPSGVKQTMRYYAASGEDGCPLDPLGFVRHLAERCVVPAAPQASAGDGAVSDTTHAEVRAPVRVSRYRYTTLRAVDGPQRFNEVPVPIVCTETTFAEVDPSAPSDTLFSCARKQCWTYFDTPSDRFLHARIKTATSEIGSHKATTRYHYSGDLDDTIRTEVTLTGFDDSTRSSWQHHARHSGLLIHEAQEDGAAVCFAYDTLGRLISETTAQGTPAEAKKTYRHTLASLQPAFEAATSASFEPRLSSAPASTSTSAPPRAAMSCAATDAAGVTSCSWFDGLERLLAITLQLPGKSAAWTSYEADYDALGRCTQETRYDAPMPAADAHGRVSATDTTIRSVVRHRYDDWGERCATTRADGVTLHDQLDPIMRTRTQWREAASGTSSTASLPGSATRITEYGQFDTPLRIAIIPCADDASPGIARETLFSYDGLGRCISETQFDGARLRPGSVRHRVAKEGVRSNTGVSRTTLWGWDVFDREVRRQLADGTVIETRHAAHTDLPLPVSLRLTSATPSDVAGTAIEIASQRFDGLDRLVSRRMGHRERRYHYRGASPYPESEQTAAGNVLASQYDPLLSYARTARDTPEYLQRYTYEATRGAMVGASSAPRTSRVSTAQGRGTSKAIARSSAVTFDYDALGRCVREQRTIDDARRDCVVTQSFSIQGHCLSRTASIPTSKETTDTATQRYRYDSAGRLNGIEAPQLNTTLGYDPFGRLAMIEAGATDVEAFACLQTVCHFDALDRETGRTITITCKQAGSANKAPDAQRQVFPEHVSGAAGSTSSALATPTVARQWHLGQSFDAFDRMTCRTLSEGDDLLRSETFRYDSRDRLIHYAVTGAHGPRDSDGRAIRFQRFVYDKQDNLLECTTDHVDNSQRHAVYHYADPTDRTRLTRIDETETTGSHEHPVRQTRSITPLYDEDGNMTALDKRTMGFDALGRLTRLGLPDDAAIYAYDALDRLIHTARPDTVKATSSTVSTADALHYFSDRLVAETIDGTVRMRLDRDNQPLALHGADEASRPPTLLATDAQGTVIFAASPLASTSHTDTAPLAYAPYGACGDTISDEVAPDPSNPRAMSGMQCPQWQGMRRDPFSGLYPVGNGKRWYDPTLMRFLSPDPLCPFDGGGIHPYLFGLGDPINRCDPSGLLSWQSILGIAIGAIGVALTIASLGTGVAISAGMIQAGAALTAFATVPSLSVSGVIGMGAAAASLAEGATSIAAAALQDSNADSANTLGWVAFGLGAAASLHGLQSAVSSVSRATQGGEQLARGVRRAVAAQAAIDTVSRVQQGVSMGASNLSDSARAALDGAGWLLGAAGWMTGIAQASAAHRQGSFTLPRQAHQAPTAAGLRATGGAASHTGARTAVQQRQLGLGNGGASGVSGRGTAGAPPSSGHPASSDASRGARSTGSTAERLLRAGAAIRNPHPLFPS